MAASSNGKCAEAAPVADFWDPEEEGFNPLEAVASERYRAAPIGYEPMSTPVPYAAAPLTAYGQASAAAPAEPSRRRTLLTTTRLANGSANKKSKSLTSFLREDRNLTHAASMIKEANLEDEILAHAKQDGVVIFAPTNAAIGKAKDSVSKFLNGNTSQAKENRATLIAQHVSPENMLQPVAENPFAAARNGGYFDDGPKARAAPRGTLVRGAVLSVQDPSDPRAEQAVFVHDPETRMPTAGAEIEKTTIAPRAFGNLTVCSIDDLLLPSTN